MINATPLSLHGLLRTIARFVVRHETKWSAVNDAMINATSLSLRGLLRTVHRIIAQLMAFDKSEMLDFTNNLRCTKVRLRELELSK